MTIIATSIPFLRLMFREVSHRSRGQYASEYHLNKINTQKSGVRSVTTRRIGVESTLRRLDDRSDIESQDGLEKMP